MIFRLFNVYGSSQASNSSYTGVIAACLNAVNQTGFFNIHGDGTQERDFLSVQDLVRALVLALDLGLEQFTAEPINLGSGRVVTIRELALLIQVLARKSIKLYHTEARQADIKYSCANTQRAREILGWEAKVTLSEGLSELFNKSSSDLIPKRTRAFAVVGDTVRN
jgi:UDP-glucose 4-epimerase